MSKNTLAINGANVVSEMSNALTSVAENLGYKPNKLELDENGKALVPIYDSENKCVIESLEKLPENVVKAVNDINALKSLEDISGVYLASAVYDLANFAENNGFSSVGKFVSEMIPRIKANYANQLYNVAKAFLKYDESGAPMWAYEFCKGCNVSNLALLMPLVNKSGSVEAFIETYIDTDMIHPRKAQKKLADELKAINGKDSKGKDSKGKEGESTNTELSLETAWALVREKVLAYELNDSEATVSRDNAVKAIDIMIDMINK